MKVLRFNQDASCCVVSAAAHQVNIYNCDPFGKCFELNDRTENDGHETSAQYDTAKQRSIPTVDRGFIIEMLFSTSLVAIADRSRGSSNGRKLKIVNTKRNSTICELSFPHEIVDVVMNRKRMCILLESDQIYVYDISCMKPLETIDLWEDHFKKAVKESRKPSAGRVLNDASRRRNSWGHRMRPRMALSGDDRSILCYTSYSATKSNPESYLLHDVVVYDALNVAPVNYLNSIHKGNISSLAVSHDGKLIATASDKGTIIRVVATGVDSEYDSTRPLLHEFRRGSRPCNLYQLVFNRNTTLLACVGDTDTIHIFGLNSTDGNGIPNEGGEDERLLANSNSDTLRDVVGSGESPKQLATFLSRHLKASIPNQHLRRDSAHIKVRVDYDYCVGFPEEFPNQVYVASSDGTFKVYTIPSTPGECVLSKTSSFT
ncbi:hypothetical protein HG536_0A06800 [Torulaspora globosa]|uniref:Autophagy-related protein 21 n=1 Tax=Torulaspora globosa TaxID=48254 RepID=A0A7G3ZBH9_9SACH|nr:uncharacterized protein HG536_0A06800 [Torulaspora globosa]QLL30865.1 hypothetical protein HG536_0A06800 [Torulaspora globosa]